MAYDFLSNSFLTLVSSQTHLHIAVVHNTALNISTIYCKVLEITLIPGVLLHHSLVMFFELQHPLFTSYYCFNQNSMSKG